MTLLTFEGQVVLVTGGNSGIGRAIAHQFAAAGASVVLVGRNLQKSIAVENEITSRGGRALGLAVELSDAAAVQNLIQRIGDQYGKLHVLVNCAGGGNRKYGLTETSPILERWHKMSGGNFLNAYLVTMLGVELMKRTGGAIVNITSTATLHGNYDLYGAMKAGLESLTRAWAVDFAPFNIRVNAVSPGWIKVSGPLGTAPDPQSTEMRGWEATASVLGRMGTPDEVAAPVLFLAGPQAAFITGATLLVDGGLSIIDPTIAGWLKANQRQGI